MEKIKKIPSLSQRRYTVITTVSTNDLIDSWLDINTAVSEGSPFMVSRLREKHLSLFSKADQLDAGARFDCIANSTSQACATENIERAVKLGATKEIKAVAA